jgi:hypothetical protein
VYIVIVSSKVRYPQVEVGNEATAFDAGTTETSSLIKQTADGITTMVEDVDDHVSTVEQKANSIESTVGRVTGSNLVNLPEQYTGSSVSDTTRRWIPKGSYVFSAYQQNAIPSYATLSLYSAKTGGQPTLKQLSSSSTVDSTNKKTGWTRHYIAFTVSSNSGNWFTVSLEQQWGYPQIETGSTPTPFNIGRTSSNSSIRQTADEIDLSIRSGLTRTGINISTGKVAVETNNFTVSKNGTQVFGVDASTGMTTMQNVNIKGSLMYHKLAVAHSHSLYNAESMNLFSVAGTLPSGKQNLALDFDTVLLTDAPKKSSSEKFTFVFPPASYFPGASVKIINGTYTGGVGAFVSSLSRIDLIVAFDQQTEEEKEDAYNNVLNAFAVATPMRCINGANQHFSAMGYFESLMFDSHDEVELISTQNYFSQTGHYVWMVVAARGGISESRRIYQSDTLVFEGGELKDII